MPASTENIFGLFLGLWEWPGNRTMTSQLISEPRPSCTMFKANGKLKKKYREGLETRLLVLLYCHWSETETTCLPHWNII